MNGNDKQEPFADAGDLTPDLPNAMSDEERAAAQKKVDADVALIANSMGKPLRKPRKPKRLSRGQRWANAASEAMAALDVLTEIQGEYQDWLDNLPENLQSSALGDKLNDVCNLDIEGAKSTVEEAEGMDMPLGFGRD